MPRPVREVPWLEQRNGVYNVRWYEPPTEEAKRRNPQAKGDKTPGPSYAGRY